MEHPFVSLEPEYARNLATMTVTRPTQVDVAARNIMKHIDTYVQAAAGANSPPAAFIGALDQRESDCDPSSGLGQGDPWNKVSRHVPKGKGPFKSKADACAFYIHYDHLDDESAPWTYEYACWKGEAWNGFGPRGHGRPTGYLWSGTSIYDPPTGPAGKYIADGKWSGTTKDQQVGIIPVMRRLIELKPELAFSALPPFVEAPSMVPVVAPPIGVGGGDEDAEWVQHSLNSLGYKPRLREDGSYGRMTMAAVRSYQLSAGFTGKDVDGLAGPMTVASIKDHLAKAVAWTGMRQ